MSTKTTRAKTPKKARASKKDTQLDYDAVKSTGRRRPPSSRIVAEHIMLPDSKRKKMLATVQDQIRNASTAAWMVRRHLDYVSKFKLQFRTGREQLDTLVTRIFHWHAQPRNFDIAERFGREEMFRMFEAEKVASGDAAMIKLRGLYLQAIESDLIAYPKQGAWNPKTKRYANIPRDLANAVNKDTGVVMDESRPGRIGQFCICNRGSDGKTVSFDHMENARNVIFDAYWTRFSSQVRGVSPLSTAINLVQDSYEGIDFNLAKAKVHALFGIALMRDYAGSSNDQEEVDGWGAVAGQQSGHDENLLTASESPEGTKQIATSLQEMKPNEMMMVDMDLKGRIDTIESKTPSTEFREFQELVLRLAFLALDIPYTAFNSRSASFSGMIADQNMYEVSCKWKREKNLWKRKEYSDWLLDEIWNDPSSEWGLREVAGRNGYNRLRDLQESVEWVPSGFPWLQKLQEVQGDIKAVGAGLDNPQDICKRRGSDFFANVDKTAEAYKYAESKGVPLMIGEPGQASVSEEQDRIEGNDNEQD